MTLRRLLATEWQLQATPDCLIVRRGSSRARVAVSSAVAAEVIAATSPGSDGEPVSPEAARVIDALDARGALSVEVVVNNEVVARHVRAPGGVRRYPAKPPTPALLQPTAYLRGGRDAVEVGSARGGDRVILLTPWAISTAVRLFDSDASVGEGPYEGELLTLFARAGLLADDDDEDPLKDWEFHDALMHAGSRFDSRTAGFGATYPEGRPSDPVTVPRPAPGDRVPLGTYPGDDGLSLYQAIKGRSSRRDHRGGPLDKDDLGALLDAALRVVRTADIEEAELAWRGVPTGGAISGLSAILLINRAANLQRGVYEYDALSHELAPASPPWPALDRWLDLAQLLTGIERTSLQALVLLTLDYRRPSSKYEAIVYATALKEAGAVLQTFALVCTELNLSFCPLGGGFRSTDGLGANIGDVAVICEMAIGRAASH